MKNLKYRWGRFNNLIYSQVQDWRVQDFIDTGDANPRRNPTLFFKTFSPKTFFQNNAPRREHHMEPFWIHHLICYLNHWRINFWNWWPLWEILDPPLLTRKTPVKGDPIQLWNPPGCVFVLWLSGLPDQSTTMDYVYVLFVWSSFCRVLFLVILYQTVWSMEVCTTAGDSFYCYTWNSVLTVCWVSHSIVARTSEGLFTSGESGSKSEKDQRINGKRLCQVRRRLPTLALKPRRDVTRWPKLGHQRPHRRTCVHQK